MNSLDRTLDGVALNPSVDASVQRLMRNLAAEVRGAAGNEEASLQLAAMLDRDAALVGTHVLASTPVFDGKMTTHPVPAASDSSKILPAVIEEPAAATAATAATGATGSTGAADSTGSTGNADAPKA